MSRPNLFSYATSELSQDAFFAWLARWADDSFKNEDGNLNKLAKDFVRFLINKQFGEFNDEIISVKTGRKKYLKNIDVWIVVNEKYLIIIEDKTGSQEHNNQLQRYKEMVGKTASQAEQIVLIYIKTGNDCQKVKNDVENKGYAYVSRQDLLEIYKSNEQTGNDIVSDFFGKLQNIEDDTQSFRVKNIEEWDRNDLIWQGFFMFLETKLDINDWHKTNNPSKSVNPNGGFWGINWCWTKWKGSYLYIQIEQGKLCFKVDFETKTAGSAEKVRTMQNAILAAAKTEGLDEITRPAHFRIGRYVTFAIVERDHWLGKPNDGADLDAVVDRLRKYEELMNTKFMNNERN